MRRTDLVLTRRYVWARWFNHEMSRDAVLSKDLVQRLGLNPDDFAVYDSPARAAPVAEVHRGHFRTRRYTDRGPGGFGLHEIIDNGQGSFENRKVELPS